MMHDHAQLASSPASRFLPTGPAPGDTPAWLSQLRIALTYGARHGRIVRCHRPRRFTEWIQWRKLHDRDERMPPLVDKLAVKDHVAAELGAEWVTPTLFEGAALPERPLWEPAFVVKSRHGCNQSAFVRTGAEDWDAIRSAARRWVRQPYGEWLDEWLYRHVPRGVMVEPFIGGGGALPVDYKIFVFGGRAAFVKVDRDRERAHRLAYYSLDWRRVWAPKGWQDPPPPQSLREMIAAAEHLGRGFDFVRADFYDVGGRPRFGELTFYPGSGLNPLPRALDYQLGGLWAEARARRLAGHRPGA